MKKMLVVMIFFVLMVPVTSIAEETAVQEFQWAPVILISADVLAVGAAVAAIIQQNTLAADYETLQNNIGDNYDEAQYYRMMYEKEKVNGAEDLVLISTIAAGAVLAYTAADFFWLHNAFKIKVEPMVNGVKTGMLVTY